MRKSIVVYIIVCLIVNSCTRTEQKILIPSVEISVAFENPGFGSLKNGDVGGVPECAELSMDYALYTVEFITETGQVSSQKQIKAPIYTINNRHVTQPVKVMLNDEHSTHARIINFFIYHTDDLSSEDIIVRAAPMKGSKFYPLVSNKLNTLFTINKFAKHEVPIDVLCFEPMYIVSFGFVWLDMSLVTIRSQCWMGTLCVDNPQVLNGSLYETLSPGEVSQQMPAILKVNVLNYIGAADGNYEDDINWDLIITHSNSTSEAYGTDQCLEVFWPDHDVRNDLFRFDVYVLMPDGDNEFSYQYYNSYAFWDAIPPDVGTDGVADFEIGDCVTNSFIACTLTQGYWKNHTGINKKSGQAYWGHINPSDKFFNTGLSYLDIYAKKPSESKYYSLAHQYIAAMLNLEVGGVDISMCPDVQQHYDAAGELLNEYLPTDDLSVVMDDLIMYAETLDLFNNGVLCSKHCD
ncbi:hypothetical protein KEM09_15655 [Carboxylicivirga mesophila]|uniref:DUF4843 domain-containing protein n=1 Tax=Carboxylicivirga mesophila TaxID=1166478 RepID=A0ABS5KEU7_9BACT|nr:hypothetical protein [Carboxylicivirga mesophila]MBS2212853.1 hypothetical protein [Carboxylicivirga mesophila]